MNICLMCKWWWKLEYEKGTWQDIVNKKYIHGNNILNIGPRTFDSHVWNDLLKVRMYYVRNIIKTSGLFFSRVRRWCLLEMGKRSLL